MSNQIDSVIQDIFTPGVFKVVLSNPVVKEPEFRKIIINKKQSNYQIEKFTQKQVFHQNVNFDGVMAFLNDIFPSAYGQLNAWDDETEYSVRVGKKGKLQCSRSKVKSAPKQMLSHNRSKNYILAEGSVIEPLVDMGIFNKQGMVVPSMYDKYKQINRFVEIIDDEVSRLKDQQSLTVIDFGCGKSYLTFILYYYLTEIRKLDVKMIGLDLKKEVIENCNKAAAKYKYDGLKFELGDINGYKCAHPVDMVVTLHACDTATDYALFNAIEWNAKMIFSVPCCQHEVNAQIKSDQFSLFTRYGIVKERMSALITDALRANMLECCGYKTQVMEFIDMSHTPKNILIRAVYNENSASDRKRELEEAERVIDEFKLNPTLYRLLKGRLDPLK